MEVVALPLASPQTEPRLLRATAASLRQFTAPAPLHLWHLASLDAPTVAIIWSLAFARAAHVSLPAWVPVLLALGTFAVYVGDRLLDARAGIRSDRLGILRDRHFFHWRHRRLLFPLAVLATATAAALIVLLMPAVSRARNSLLAAAALVYFSSVHGPRQVPVWLQRTFSKELLVGVLFTAGCALPTLSRLGLQAGSAVQALPLATAIAAFAALAWLNCHAIDRWESSADSSRLGIAALSLAAFTLAAATLFIAAQPRVSALFTACAASAALLALLHNQRLRVAPLTLRAAADLVLLTPLILVVR